MHGMCVLQLQMCECTACVYAFHECVQLHVCIGIVYACMNRLCVQGEYALQVGDTVGYETGTYIEDTFGMVSVINTTGVPGGAVPAPPLEVLYIQVRRGVRRGGGTGGGWRLWQPGSRQRTPALAPPRLPHASHQRIVWYMRAVQQRVPMQAALARARQCEQQALTPTQSTHSREAVFEHPPWAPSIPSPAFLVADVCPVCLRTTTCPRHRPASRASRTTPACTRRRSLRVSGAARPRVHAPPPPLSLHLSLPLPLSLSPALLIGRRVMRQRQRL
jgi:hypothetical protein